MKRRTAHSLLVFWLLLVAAVLSPLVWGAGAVESAPDAPGADFGRIADLASNSVFMSLLATLLACAVAVPVAVVATRLESRRGRFVLLVVACLPLFVPPPVMAVAAIRLFGPAGLLTKLLTGGAAVFPVTEQIRGPAPQLAAAPIYSLAGGAFTIAWCFAPLVVLAVASVLARAGSSAERAALLDTTPVGTLLRITLPRAFGGIAAGAGLVFLFAMTEFGVPESLRSLPVLVSEVYVQAGVFFDMRASLAAGLAAFAIASVLIALLWPLLKRAAGSFDEDDPDDGHAFPPSAPIRVLRVAGWSLGTLPPLFATAVLFFTAGGPQGRLAVWSATWSTASDEFLFTLLLGGVLALLAGVLGTLLGVALSRARTPGPWRLACALPLVLPGPLFGVALQIMLRRPPGSLPMNFDDALAALSQTHVPLLLVWTIRYAPIVAFLAERALRGVPTVLVDSARSEGAGPFALFARIQWPWVWPAIVAGMLAAFALSLGEVGAAVLLLPPGVTTLGVRLLTLMHYAPTGQVSALCLLVLLPGTIAAAGGALLLRRPGPVAYRTLR